MERGRWTGAKPNLHTYHVSQAGISLACGASGKALDWSYRPTYWDGGGDQGNSSNASANFGTDARYRITPNLSATLSYNTDFAEAEVDQRQLNFTRFLFFPERRPSSWRTVVCLNMEGLTTSSRTRGLSRPVLPFFSRRIGRDTLGRSVPILLAAKIAGRHGKTSMGFIDAVFGGPSGA